MLTDDADNCLVFALRNDENNAFTVTEARGENAQDAAPPVEIPGATVEIARCDLAVPIHAHQEVHRTYAQQIA